MTTTLHGVGAWIPWGAESAKLSGGAESAGMVTGDLGIGVMSLERESGIGEWRGERMELDFGIKAY